ncbi:hypothetical protein [Nocardia asteroides]|uniref:hypothetical protein n=1 Tax=Nocardia asteroides TaxID=1824 RepID=UPI001E5F5EA8|nr:hypothetical protein [Nocardia asteroides]UGT59936.1 hypothetical protein LTT61_22290 [Nocardia asteroides]
MTASRPGLPHWRELTTAFRVPVRDDVTLLLKCARALAEMHRVRARYPGHYQLRDNSRRVLRDQIAEWIVGHAGVGAVEAATCALVIDDMAAAHVIAERLLCAEPPASSGPLHAAWFDVGRLATQWSDLVAEVIDGQPPLSRR